MYSGISVFPFSRPANRTPTAPNGRCATGHHGAGNGSSAMARFLLNQEDQSALDEGLDLRELTLKHPQVGGHCRVAVLAGERTLSPGRAAERPLRPVQCGEDRGDPRPESSLLARGELVGEPQEVGVEQRLEVLARTEQVVAQVATDRPTSQRRP